MTFFLYFFNNLSKYKLWVLRNANDLLQVLSNYPNLQGDTNVISLGMCPIKSKYIISNFPYYKGKQINVKDGIITILPIKDEELSTYNVSTVPKIFNYLKKSVSFDGNYERFRSIIKSVNIELIELIEIYSIFYNLNGFSCAVIAAEILNHYNNIKTNSENMYILLSKLTPFEIKHLDTALKNSCKLEDSKMDPMDILLRSSLKDVRAISTKRIENAMKELIRIPKFSSKINRISMKNYSFLSVEIIQFYKKQTRLNTKERECIILLLLYSDVSNMLKNWAYDSLSKKGISKNDFDIKDNNNNNINRQIQRDNLTSTLSVQRQFIPLLFRFDYLVLDGNQGIVQ